MFDTSHNIHYIFLRICFIFEIFLSLFYLNVLQLINIVLTLLMRWVIFWLHGISFCKVVNTNIMYHFHIYDIAFRTSKVLHCIKLIFFLSFFLLNNWLIFITFKKSVKKYPRNFKSCYPCKLLQHTGKIIII